MPFAFGSVSGINFQFSIAFIGILTSRFITKSKTCQELWDTCLKHKANVVKPQTLNLYRLKQKGFFEAFSPSEPIEKITADKCLDWKTSLLAKHATATVAGHVKVAKMVFDWAVDQEWLTKNPLKKIPNGSFINRDKDRTISMEEYAKLLDACPNQEWRTLVALARIGGLRCPSELKRLRWSDIDWVKNRFLVRATKTERYIQHRERIVPLFPVLRAELERHFSSDETKENEFVIEHYQKTCWNLHSPFCTIARRAGLDDIVRPFDNMRMSRSNEVLTRWGQAKESVWIGHSVEVMKDHYLCLSDTDFAEAAEADLESPIPHAHDHAKPTETDDKLE